jgi:transcriptional regulator with GAF, ATPase, and Fis domain
MPVEYFEMRTESHHELACQDELSWLPSLASLDRSVYRVESQAAEYATEPLPDLENALQELGIFIASASLRQAAEHAAVVAQTGVPVLLLGETGTGKELFARLLHRLSDRREEKLVPLNCAAIPKELVESHLFGHIRGAFTGATHDQKGKFREADGGTLFLDEIGELTLDAQAKLLRVLEDGLVEPLGSNKLQKVDVRIIAATNRNLQEEIVAGRFRKDLYYRLETVQIRLPRLGDRRAEIPMLAMALLDRINQRFKHQRRLSKDALHRLELHDWPGNVRELRNVLERSVLYARKDVLGPEDLLISKETLTGDPLAALPEPADGFSLEEFLAKVRKHLFLRALAKANGNQAAAAGLLGVSKQAVSKFVTGEAGNSG